MNVTVRLTVRKDRGFTKSPHFISPPSKNTGVSYYSTTGVGPRIKEATKAAIRNMIEYLSVKYKLSRVEAYMLCSVAADLRLHEVVS